MGAKKKTIQYAYLLTKMGALSEGQKERLIHQLKNKPTDKK
ncbi:hypothetical protein [Bacillus sp. FJAT-45037]|nr:hypothetical protein [Bacillus sp. FJAT-45037]